MTDSIKLLEDGLTPLIERIRNFEFTEKNKHSKIELNRIIERIESLPKYMEDDLNVFVTELKKLPQYTEEKLIAFIEDFKTAPKKNESQIRDEIKALKCQPKMGKKDLSILDNHLRCFPEYTDDELIDLLEYIKIFPERMEEEINNAIEEIKQLPLLRYGNIDALLQYIKNKELSEQTKKGLINFIRRIASMKHLNFYYSIKHLERDSQEQITILTDIIRKKIPKCSMIVLFGSYARGTEVIYDEYIDENGSRLSYQSDFDIMVVLPRSQHVAEAHRAEGNICSEIKDEYDNKFPGILHAPPQFIVESEKILLENLEINHPFFSDIIKEGIFLYNDGRISLPEPKELLYQVKKELAQKHFGHLNYADTFLKYGKIGYIDEEYVTASFQIHQACENYYRDISMVFINYSPKLHDLKELIDKTMSFSSELSTVFPRVTDFEKQVFKLLRDAYVDARYKLDFAVTKEELEYMIERAEILKEIAYRICPKQIEYYEQKAKEE